MIQRDEAVKIAETNIADKICTLYNLDRTCFSLLDGHEGCQNIIFMYSKNTVELAVRISFRKDRSFNDVLAETHFVNFLFENGVRVSNPVKSVNGNFAENISVQGMDFYTVVFTKAKGESLPANGYRYRDGAPIDEYFYNYGKMIGHMHRITQKYEPLREDVKRTEWITAMKSNFIEKYIPPELSAVKEKFLHLCDEAQKLPKDKDAYGLIHADFNDGNFCIDYNTGDITAFDFDDSAYCWFMYDIADAWSKGVGWCRWESDVQKRKDFMAYYFETVLKGYKSENTINDAWLDKLSFFLKLVEMEGFLNELHYMITIEGGIEYDEYTAYRIECITKDIPYMGFFDPVYSSQNPFCLVKE